MKYFWKQCYEIGDRLHWALCDEESEKVGKVTCVYMVLLSDHFRCFDGLDVDQQDGPVKVVKALNAQDGIRAMLDDAEANAASEALAGNIVKEAHWRGEVSALKQALKLFE